MKLRLKYDALFVRTVGNSTLFLDHHCFTNGLLYYIRSINLNRNNLFNMKKNYKKYDTFGTRICADQPH